jgi:hypothetical protein
MCKHMKKEKPITSKRKPTKNKPGKPFLAARRVKDVIGKVVLIGLTYYKDGQQPELKQLYGRVTNASKGGIDVELDGSHKGEVFTLPPGIRAFEYAGPGYYRFRSSEEGVENPDFIVTYDIYSNKQTYMNSSDYKKANNNDLK